MSLPPIDFSRVGPAVGAPFPDVRLPDQLGRSVDLHRARAGKKALVVFHRSASWWPYCKTQLVELQGRLEDLDRAGYALFAISYDPVDVLGAFAARHGVTYPLLSDLGSRVISQLGLYNDHLAEQAAHYGGQAREHQHGVPYPGIVVLDERGRVVEKRFEQGYRVRPSGTALVEDLSAAPVSGPSDAVERGEPRLRAWTSDTAYRPYQQLNLHVELALPRGLHVYGRPIPAGYTPLEVQIEPVAGLVVGETRLPAPRPFAVASIAEQFVVYEGRVEAVVPFHLEKVDGPPRLGVRVRYQACTETLCHPPAEARIELPLASADLVRE